MNVTQEDLVREINNGNRMAIRFHVARIIGEYFYNKLMGDMRCVDFQGEIKRQANFLIERYDKGESVSDLIREFERKQTCLS